MATGSHEPARPRKGGQPADRLREIVASSAPSAVALIRAAVGIVFLSEGIQKFLYPAALGIGRFAKIGIPGPEVMGPFIAVIEIVCGAFVLAGFLTRIAALLLIADMAVAILSTKVPIVLGHGYWLFTAPSGPKPGLWSMLHEARTDLSMLLGSMFLFLVGAGKWSVDVGIIAPRIDESRADRGRLT